ncbi:MAG: M28 family peptidase [Sphingobacteriia bacterium]|nr:M28 family peptidase [Sphingobacteriia bacterium]
MYYHYQIIRFLQAGFQQSFHCRFLLFALIFSFLLFSCGNKNQKKSPAAAETKQTEKVSVPDFNADSAYYYVEKQLSFGPRVPGSEAHAQCAGWLESTLRRFSAKVYVQDFKARVHNNQVFNGQNIIAVFNPEQQRRILFGAHWDSRPYADHDPDPANHNKPIDGANDGASGTGVLLEIARQLHEKNPSVGVDIILFDLEDYGPPKDRQTNESTDMWGLGSQYWARNPHVPNYKANFGILLDMVGAPDAKFPLEGFSMHFAPDIKQRVWELAARIGYADYFIFEQGGYITDDHYFVNVIAGIPMIDIIHLDATSSNGTFFEYWHTVKDNIDQIDAATLKVVGDVVMHVIFLGI